MGHADAPFRALLCSEKVQRQKRSGTSAVARWRVGRRGQLICELAGDGRMCTQNQAVHGVYLGGRTRTVKDEEEDEDEDEDEDEGEDEHHEGMSTRK